VFSPLIDEIPNDLEIDGIGGRPTVTIPLAASDDGSQWVAVEVRLWPWRVNGVECHTFKFAIVHFDDAASEPAVIFDRNMAAGYLEAVRHLVMPSVCAAARALVEAVQPDVIYRATYFCKPPDKSMPKHNMVTEAIRSAGYKLSQSETDGHGRVFWVMIRHGDE
jgi:hypothetical protein